MKHVSDIIRALEHEMLDCQAIADDEDMTHLREWACTEKRPHVLAALQARIEELEHAEPEPDPVVRLKVQIDELRDLIESLQ